MRSAISLGRGRVNSISAEEGMLIRGRKCVAGVRMTVTEKRIMMDRHHSNSYKGDEALVRDHIG